MKNTTFESFKVNGEALLKKVKELIKEGNVRKITISNKEGKEFYISITISTTQQNGEPAFIAPSP